MFSALRPSQYCNNIETVRYFLPYLCHVLEPCCNELFCAILWLKKWVLWLLFWRAWKYGLDWFMRNGRVTPCQLTQATEGTPKLLKECGWHDSFGNWWVCGDQVGNLMCVSAETACAGRDHWYKFQQHVSFSLYQIKIADKILCNNAMIKYCIHSCEMCLQNSIKSIISAIAINKQWRKLIWMVFSFYNNKFNYVNSTFQLRHTVREKVLQQ